MLPDPFLRAVPEPDPLAPTTPEDRRRLRWHGLGTPSQKALAWAVTVGGVPAASDRRFLRVLVRDGLAVEREPGVWSASVEGRAVYAAGTGRAL